MPDSPPNILFIMTDQQRFDTIAALGHNPVIRTPALDRLANEGVAFTSAYSPSPVCVPARGCLYYGQYTQNTGCYDNGNAMPQDGRPSMWDALTRAGYRTHAIGKLHMVPERLALRGLETRQSQEELLGEPDTDDYLVWLRREHGMDHIADPHGVRGEMYYIPQPAQMSAELHPTQWVGDQSVNYIREHSGGDRPWHLTASFIHPHPPFCPPAPWHKLYRAFDMPLPKLPPNHESLHVHVNRHQNRYKYRDQGFDLNLNRCQRAYYFGCISFIDYQVGRMLRALEELGQLDNTLIMFTSDHGELLGDYECFGKRSFHDSCARVPLLARLPGRLEGGQRCARPASLIDIMPTALAAAGVDRPGGLDGVDLADLATGRSDRDIVFSQYSRGPRAIYTAVTERWKYVYSAPDQRALLFDRQGDPDETRDKAGTPFAREPLEAMQQRTLDFLRQVGETDALDGDGWRVYPKAEMPQNPDAGLLVQDHSWAKKDLPGYSPDDA